MKDTPPVEQALEEGYTDNRQSPVTGADEMEIGPLQLARDAYNDSTNYVNTNLRRQWERNIANFMSRHPSGSKYRSPAYSSRSKIFRPKTRSAIRQNEAAAVAAFFSTQDVVSIAAEDTNNDQANISADLLMELINYRLTGSSIPWFKIVIGAFQDAQVMGDCVGRVEWVYTEKETGEEELDLESENEDGSLKYKPVVEVVKDRPEVTLVPGENFRLSPGASWLDPINSSPYLIELIPMYVKDIRAEMKKEDPKTGAPKWKPLTDQQLLSALSENIHDSTRQAREDGRQDRTDNPTSITSHTQVWVHRNIMEIDGEDYQWYTLGTSHILSDPVRLSEVILHGMRPYVIGHSVIEAHRSNPSSLVELGQELQAASNDNFNQRFDNIKLALNSRSFVRRAASVDLRALKRSVPGGLVMVGNIDKDVKPIEVRDVTGSSYADQDRINNDFDEVMGSFSQSSINSNRKLGETVGGMGMIKDNSNIMTEYVIRTYAETFVEGIIRHLVALEKAYETDPDVLRIAGDRAKVPDGTVITNEMLQHNVDVSIEVGYGATDPVRKIQKFSMALNSVAVVPGLIGKLKEEDVVGEVFGNAGYKNGHKFFEGLGEAPAEQGPNPEMLKIEIEQFKAENSALNDRNKLIVTRELGFAKLALEEKIKLPQLYEDLGIKQSEMQLEEKKHGLDVLKEMGKREDNEIDRRELHLKETTDKDGI